MNTNNWNAVLAGRIKYIETEKRVFKKIVLERNKVVHLNKKIEYENN